jgi:hypothetical protein
MKIRFITSLLMILITPAFVAPSSSGAKTTTNQVTASGTVKDSETKETLIGANVVALDSANKELKTNNGNLIGDSTDDDGKFKITNQIPTGSKLRISHIGYETQTVSAGSNLNILMKPSIIALDEVEVVGTQTGKPCTTNGAETATYKKIGNEIKCVASTCKSKFYLVVDANGNSQGWCTAKKSCPENQEMKIIDGTKTDRSCVDKIATTPDNEETAITPNNEDGTVATECTPDSTNPECDCPDDKIREVDNTCVDETALYKQAKAEMINKHTQLTTQTEQLNNSEAQ